MEKQMSNNNNNKSPYRNKPVQGERRDQRKAKQQRRSFFS